MMKNVAVAVACAAAASLLNGASANGGYCPAGTDTVCYSAAGLGRLKSCMRNYDRVLSRSMRACVRDHCPLIEDTEIGMPDEIRRRGRRGLLLPEGRDEGGDDEHHLRGTGGGHRRLARQKKEDVDAPCRRCAKNVLVEDSGRRTLAERGEDFKDEIRTIVDTTVQETSSQGIYENEAIAYCMDQVVTFFAKNNDNCVLASDFEIRGGVFNECI